MSPVDILGQADYLEDLTDSELVEYLSGGYDDPEVLGSYEILGDDGYGDDELLGRSRARGILASRYGRTPSRTPSRSRGRMPSRGRGMPRRQPMRYGPGYAPPQTQQMADAIALSRSTTLVKETVPSKSRHQVLGFDSVTDVAAAGSATITKQPQTIFRPNRFVVPQAIAPSFLIDDIKVGKNSQFIAAGAIPAESMSQQAFSVELQFDTAAVSQQVVITVSNISLSGSRFTATMFGTSLEAS